MINRNFSKETFEQVLQEKDNMIISLRNERSGLQETTKDLTQICCMVCQMLEHRGTIYKIFDECYEIAKKFQEKYSHDKHWVNQELELDEAISKFITDERL